MKTKLILVSLIAALMLCSCKSSRDAINQLSDYRPMVFVNDTLYGETSKVVSELPSGVERIGTIIKIVSQSEPMINENFCSNNCPIGSEIYYSEETPGTVFIKIVSPDIEQYSVYEIIN